MRFRFPAPITLGHHRSVVNRFGLPARSMRLNATPSVAPLVRLLHGAGALSSGIESPIRDCFTHLPLVGRWVSENGAVAFQTKTITHQSSRFRHSSLAQRTRSRLDFAVHEQHSGRIRDAFRSPFKVAFMYRGRAQSSRLSVRNETTNDAFGCRIPRAAGIERAHVIAATPHCQSAIPGEHCEAMRGR